MKYMISEMSLNPTTKNSSLTIRSVNLSDNGTYTCNATSLSYSATSSGILTVHGEYIIIIARDIGVILFKLLIIVSPAHYNYFKEWCNTNLRQCILNSNLDKKI